MGASGRSSCAVGWAGVSAGASFMPAMAASVAVMSLASLGGAASAGAEVAAAAGSAMGAGADLQPATTSAAAKNAINTKSRGTVRNTRGSVSC